MSTGFALRRVTCEHGLAFVTNSTSSTGELLCSLPVWHAVDVCFHHAHVSIVHHEASCKDALSFPILLARHIRPRTFLTACVTALYTLFFGAEHCLTAMTVTVDPHSDLLLHSNRFFLERWCPLAYFQRHVIFRE